MDVTQETVPLPGIPVSAGALIYDRAGRLLILKPTYKSGWTIPGGVMEADGESPWEACQREVREETGLEAEVVEKLGDVKYWYVRKWSDGERVFKVVSFFLLRYVSGSLRDYQRSEVDGAEWIPLEEAPRRLAYRGEKDMAKLALSKHLESG